MLHLKFAVIVTLAIASQNHNALAEKVTLTGPSRLLPTTSKENTRFSRLLHQNAAALQFSSISNLAPPISGLAKDIKDIKGKNQKKATLSTTHLGRRTLDYDDSESFDDNGHPLPRIITEPQPGNEYVYIRQGGIQTDEQQAAAASVTSINREPANQRPLTLLRQSNGKRVNISPVFSNDEYNTKRQNPIFQKDIVSVPSDREYELASDDLTTTAVDAGDIDDDVTTTSMVPLDKEEHQEDRQMIVNVVTSEPRIEFEDQNKTSPSKIGTTTTTKPSVIHAKYNIPEEQNPSTDLKENLVVQSSRRIGSFPDFEDSPTRLQTAESASQPARVNVRPAQSGKEYEYEYIYYYYDDEDEDNSTSKTPGKAENITKTQGSSRGTTRVSSTPVSVASKIEPDFEDEELEEFDEEVPEVVKPSPAHVKSSESVKLRAPVPEKLSNTNPINQLDRSRSPKAIPVEKAIVPEADYKLEAGDFEQYENEDEQIQVKAKGQPQRSPTVDESEDDEPETHLAQEPQPKVTSAPTSSTSASSQDSMSTMAKSHPDSVNSPVILKQSNLLQSVPASKFQPQTEAPTQETSPLTTPSTTTTEAVSEATPSVRPPSSRFRGQQRIRGSSTAEASKVRQQLVATENAVSDQPEETVAKPTPSSHRSFSKDSSSRRTPSRRPQVETSQPAPESPAQIPSSSQDAPVRNPVRTRFPPRISPTLSTTTTDAAPIPQSSSTEASIPVVEVEEPKEEQAKENYVRSKSANDLFTFTRLQQAISSRAPARKDVTGKGPVPSKSGGFLNSNEQSTDATTSSEATTIHPFIDAAHSSEQAAPVTSTTTTSTTTEATQLDKFGKPRNRFSRTRRPLVASANAGSTASPVTEASVSSASRVPPQNRNRFSGRRKPTTTTPEEIKQTDEIPSTSSVVSETPRPRIPSRNRFATRNRGQSSTTEETFGKAHEDEKKETPLAESSVPTSQPAQTRRKPIFQGRRRNPNIGGHNATTTAQQEENVASSPASLVKAGEVQGANGDETKRPTGLGNIQRRRPGVGPRIRGGRLGASTSTTTEAAIPVSNGNQEQDQVADIEQSPTTQSEQIEQVAPSLVPSSVASIVDNTNQRGNVGVVGRLRTRTKLATTTTTAAPEPVVRERKPSRLNGILNRRKPGVPLATTTNQPKEELKVEALEEANNNAKEQEDSLHKGVVVQVSSSVTESEEQKEHHLGEEETEQSSTTAASILNRLKSQRKPGSIFRKRTDPHGE